MSWAYMNAITARIGVKRIDVPEALPFDNVLAGWAILIAGELYELDDGVVVDANTSELWLTKPWALPQYDGPAAIIPVNASIQDLLTAMKAEIASIESTRELFDMLTWRQPNEWLRVTHDGARIETVNTIDLATQLFGEFGADPTAAAEGFIAQLTSEWTITLPAGETIVADRAVSVNAQNEIMLSDPMDADLHKSIGIAYNGASIGEQVAVRIRGLHAMTGLTPGESQWLGPNGTLLNTRPVEGYLMLLGTATTDHLIVHTRRQVEEEIVRVMIDNGPAFLNFVSETIAGQPVYRMTVGAE